MSKLEFHFWCVVLSFILGGCWGGLIFWFHSGAGVSIGLSLFLFTYVVLVNIGKHDEEELPQHNRRFNDV